jgi:hypothetical protein
MAHFDVLHLSSRCCVFSFCKTSIHPGENVPLDGALVTDPPLSALGHRQARETANFLHELISTSNWW